MAIDFLGSLQKDIDALIFGNFILKEIMVSMTSEARFCRWENMKLNELRDEFIA